MIAMNPPAVPPAMVAGDTAPEYWCLGGILLDAGNAVLVERTMVVRELWDLVLDGCEDVVSEVSRDGAEELLLVNEVDVALLCDPEDFGEEDDTVDVVQLLCPAASSDVFVEPDTVAAHELLHALVDVVEGDVSDDDAH